MLGLGTTAGIVAMALALVPPLRRAGVRIRWFGPTCTTPAVRKALALSGWTLGYVVANQIAAQTVNVLAEPGSGDVTTYNVAFMFFQLPHGLLAVSLMTTFQPDLARAAVHRDWSAVPPAAAAGPPAAGGGRRAGRHRLPGARAQRRTVRREANGLLTDGATLPVAGILGGFALGLIGFSMYLFVLRGFYALQDTRTPFLVNCVENALNIVLAVILVRALRRGRPGRRLRHLVLAGRGRSPWPS